MAESKDGDGVKVDGGEGKGDLVVEKMTNAEECLWVTDVVEGSPGEQAGLLLGDVILHFNDFWPTKEMDFETTMQTIGGIV